MTKQERAAIISEELDRLIPDPHIPLNHENAYTLLISVLLSAQCTDARVNQVTPALFALAHTPQDMAQTDIAAVRDIIRPCGLFDRKAESIVSLSRILTDQYEGKVPCSFEALESLPGVGHKTASVIMTQAFGIPAFPVDTHIFRLAKRWKLSSGKNVEAVERDLKHIFPRSAWGKIHLQIVLYGRTYCPARDCRGLCPICQRLYIIGKKRTS